MTLIEAIELAKEYNYNYVAIDENGDMCIYEDEPEYKYNEFGETFWDLDDGTKIECIGNTNYSGGLNYLLNINELKL